MARTHSASNIPDSKNNLPLRAPGRRWLCLGLITFCVGTTQANSGIDQTTRNCVAEANSATALAGCELEARKRWQARVKNNDQRLRFSLDDRLRALYIASQQAWELYRDAEFKVLEATLAARNDGLAGALAEGAKTEVMRKRAEQQDTLLKSMPIKSHRR